MAAASTDNLTRLRAPFPVEAIGKLPRSTCKACSDARNKRCDQHTWVRHCPECKQGHSSATMHLDYVGHADVTARLLEVDPTWSWEPMGFTPEGVPALDREGNLWIRLTVLGVTRPAVGDGKNMKERIGDAIRNGAMRAGVALDLWAKGDREWAHADKAADEPTAPVQDQPARQAQRPRQDAQPSQDGSAEPQALPAHLKPFTEAFDGLTDDQQAWVVLNRPWTKHPRTFTVAEVAQAVEWMAGNVPPAGQVSVPA